MVRILSAMPRFSKVGQCRHLLGSNGWTLSRSYLSRWSGLVKRRKGWSVERVVDGIGDECGLMVMEKRVLFFGLD